VEEKTSYILKYKIQVLSILDSLPSDIVEGAKLGHPSSKIPHSPEPLVTSNFSNFIFKGLLIIESIN
jgi:hypothetical protein